MNDLTRRVGERLRARRQALGLSIRALAAGSGLSERYVILAEKGEANLSLEKLQALGAALDLSLPALVSEGARGEVDALLSARTPAELAEVASWLRARFAGGDDRGRIVALLGVRGAGKSTVGRRLAARLNREFVELDRRVEQAADLGLSELFALHGEDYYRRLEAEALERLIHGPGACVVATGGSIVTHAENYARLRAGALTVWLRATPEDHWDRVIRQGDRRPMRDHPHAMAELRALLDAREPLYRQADVVVDTSGVPVEAVVEQVATALASGDALS
jgi:XRE family aerobic/anaerobic benzoate catabolism transcriptional regulator